MRIAVLFEDGKALAPADLHATAFAGRAVQIN